MQLLYLKKKDKALDWLRLYDVKSLKTLLSTVDNLVKYRSLVSLLEMSP